MLALLLHDVGKSRDEEHVPESVRLARGIFERLALPAESREVVEFLIANHLQMSMVAFRRDTEDPETVRRFAALVGVEERLKMLCLLTLADVDAVSLETLTPWKEELLWRLYVDTYNQLTLGYGDELIDRSQSELAQLRRRRATPICRRKRFPGSSRAFPAATSSSSIATPSSATSGSRATSTRTRCTSRSSGRAPPGS